ncbi:hypothetical protein BKA81DRAFT_224404 [Phyllosticta paracitricarpa]
MMLRRIKDSPPPLPRSNRPCDSIPVMHLPASQPATLCPSQSISRPFTQQTAHSIQHTAHLRPPPSAQKALRHHFVPTSTSLKLSKSARRQCTERRAGDKGARQVTLKRKTRQDRTRQAADIDNSKAELEFVVGRARRSVVSS